LREKPEASVYDGAGGWKAEEVAHREIAGAVGAKDNNRKRYRVPAADQ
jgi:serine/threonine protein phosphatase PrpC